MTEGRGAAEGVVGSWGVYPRGGLSLHRHVQRSACYCLTTRWPKRAEGVGRLLTLPGAGSAREDPPDRIPAGEIKGGYTEGDQRLREHINNSHVRKGEVMSLRPEPPCPIPPETAHVAHAAFPRRNPYLRLRDHFGALYTGIE